MEASLVEFIRWGSRMIADVVERPYGHIFYSPENALCHPANAAHIMRFANMEAVIEDVTTFFLEQDITPRVHSSACPGEEALLPVLTQYGYTVEEFDMPWYMWTPRELPADGEHNIKRVMTLVGKEMDFALASLDPWGALALKRAMRDPDNMRVFMAYDGDTPAAIGSLRRFVGTSGTIGVIENLFTDPFMERNGLATAITRRLINEHAAMGGGMLALEAVSDISIGIFEKEGFVPSDGPLYGFEAEMNEAI